MDYTIDAKKKRLGRLASEVAIILMGKKTPAYHPALVGDDRVILKNYREITVSGSKNVQKTYYRHTGYMGHLKEISFQQMMDRDPRKIIIESVRRMLPKNFLNQRRMKNLIFSEET